MDDKKIIELYNVRSEMAIAETALKYGCYADRVAYNVLRSKEDAEEVVMDAYMKLWKSIPPVVPKNLKAFLAKVTRNLALDKYEKENAEKRGGGQVELCLDEIAEFVPDADMSEEGATSVINDYLRTCNKQQVKMFVRRYWYLDSIEAIAIECGCSNSKVKTTLFRMRQSLKAELNKEGINI